MDFYLLCSEYLSKKNVQNGLKVGSCSFLFMCIILLTNFFIYMEHICVCGGGGGREVGGAWVGLPGWLRGGPSI